MNMRKILLIIVAVAMLLAVGCIKQEEKKDVGIGVTLARNGNYLQVIAKDNMLGAEISINKVIQTASINAGNNLKIAETNSENTLVAVVKDGTEIKAGEVLFSIENIEEGLEVKLCNSIKKEDVKTAQVKRGSVESLLGDFDADDKVGITDFNIFIGIYASITGDAKYKAIYDISNAAYGTSTGWEKILATNTPDGKVNIYDFINFSANYGKAKPVSEITAKSIEIIGADTVEKDKIITLTAKVIYSDNSEKIETLKWSSSDIGVATVTDGAVKGIKAGTALITASKEGTALSQTKSITVKEITIFDGIKVHVKGYTHVWAWDITKNYTGGTWPGLKMTDEGDGWACWQAEGLAAANLIFSNSGSSQTATLSITEKGEYWYVDGKFTKIDQQKDVTAPEITTTPTAGNQEAVSIQVVLTAKDNKDTAPKVYYTLDNTIPTIASTLYSSSIALTSDKTIKAIAIDESGNVSVVYTFVFKLNQDATAPVVTTSIAPGRYVDAQNITLTVKDNRDAAPKIYYTTDGTIVTTSSTIYAGQAISVPKNMMIKYLAVDASGNIAEDTLRYYIGPLVVNGDFREETIYFAMTTRFYDGNTANNVNCWDEASWFNNPVSDPSWRGDFGGLVKKLDYIKALGFSAIWITPPVKNASGIDYHGYHAVDMTEIDPRYDENGNGSGMDEYQNFIDACHSKGIKVIQDIVINHTGNFGEENLLPLFNMDSSLGDNGGYAGLKDPTKLVANDYLNSVANMFYKGDYTTLIPGSQYGSRISALKEDTTDVNKLYHHEKSMSYESYTEQIGQMAGDCVDLNTENPTTIKYLENAYDIYIKMGVDAFRIDTVKHVSRLSFNKQYIPHWKATGGENFYMFGEVCTRVREVWNKGIAADSAPFYTWKESKEYPWGDEATNSVSVKQLWTDNADVNGQPESSNVFLNGNTYHAPDYSKNSGLSVIDFAMHWNFYEARNAFGVAVGQDKFYNDASWNVVYVDSHDYAPDECQKFRYTGGTDAWAENLSLMFTFRGIPCLYYGSEIEFQKGLPIDPADGDFRVPFAKSGRAYFGDYLEGTVTASDYSKYTASGKVAETLSYPLAKHIQRLNLIRRAVPALQKGQYSVTNVTGNMAFKRRYTNEAEGIDSFVLVTISGSATFGGIPNGTYVDAITGKTVAVTGGTLTAECLGKGNMRVYVLNGTGIIGEAGTFLK